MTPRGGRTHKPPAAPMEKQGARTVPNHFGHGACAFLGLYENTQPIILLGSQVTICGKITQRMKTRI